MPESQESGVGDLVRRRERDRPSRRGVDGVTVKAPSSGARLTGSRPGGRFFLKSYGKMYTALADAAFIMGQALWRVRRRIQRKPDTDPPQLLTDAIRHSVFCTGFRLTEVENPAFQNPTIPP